MIMSNMSAVGITIFEYGMGAICDLTHATNYREVRKILEDLLDQSDKLQQLHNDGNIMQEEFTFLNKHLLSVGTFAINRYFQLQEE